MKDYFKYLTVGELQDQIKDTLLSAKQKINRISLHSVDNPSFVNQKFYNYVSEIKNKQRKYDSIMNQSQELNCLLNERRKRIDQSLDKYQRNKKCKTMSSVNQNLYKTATSVEVKQQKYSSVHRLNNMTDISERKMEVDNMKQADRYRTEPRQQKTDISQEKPLIKNMKIVQRRQKILTEPLQIIKENEGESKKLRSITKVINIRIDNVPNQKLFSFAKNTINYDIKAQNENMKVEAAKKKINFQTAPAQTTHKIENNIVVQKPKEKQKSKEKQKPRDNKNDKNSHRLLNVSQRSMIRVRQRLRQNEERLLKLCQKQKKQECTKMLLLKYEYQTLQRNDLKVKLVSSNQTYLKTKHNRNARC